MTEREFFQARRKAEKEAAGMLLAHLKEMEN